MGSDDENELRSLLAAFSAQKTPSKLTPAKVRQKTPRSVPATGSDYAKSKSLTVTPLPSPLTVYARSSARTETPHLLNQSPSSARTDTLHLSKEEQADEPVQLSKEEQAEAIVLALIQDRATGVDWDVQPHISNLGSVFHLEYDEAVEKLGIWYPCIARNRLLRAVERYRFKVEKEEDEEMEMEIIEVTSKIGSSFDSAIVLDSEEEMVEADHKTRKSFDRVIVISDEENHSKVQEKKSVETSKVLLPARYQTPPLSGASVDIETPETPNNAQDVIELPTPFSISRPLVQHSHKYPSPAKTPIKNLLHTSFIRVDRTSPSPQQRSVKTTPARAKRSKLLKVDACIEIPNVVLKAQRDDPSEILVPKGSTQLPKDRMVLALLSEHKDTQRFVANVFERRLLWASELRGILSVDTIQRCGRYNRGLEVGVGDETCDLY